MTDIDPQEPIELPDYLVQAILSEEPPAAAIDVVKGAMSWRTIDADLMDLAFDSLAVPAGVRDASSLRTFEFQTESHSILLEVDGNSISGRLVPAVEDAEVTLQYLDADQTTKVAGGGFSFPGAPSGAARVTVTGEDLRLVTPTFVVGGSPT